MTKEFHIVNNQSVAESLSAISVLPTTGRYRVVIEETQKDSTPRQKRSMHLYLSMMAKGFNDAGIDQKAVIEKFKDGFSIPVTQTFLKEVWRIIMSGMFGKTSTTKLTTVETQEIYKTFNLGMAEKYGVSKPWPHIKEKQQLPIDTKRQT